MTDVFEPADKVLAVDIGNSRIGLGIWDDDGFHDARRCDADQPGAMGAALEEIWAMTADAKKRVVAISNVNPPLARQFADLVVEKCQLDPLFVRDDLPLPLQLDVDNPREVGVDRVCSAAAAHDRTGEACAVASFGTAVTIDCVTADGRFHGGAIFPGLDIACEALHQHTAKLPRVAPISPGGIFARNTFDAIVNGVVYSAAGALREIVERFATELGSWPKLIVTGGRAPLILETVDFVDAHVPDLCLIGVALAYRRASEKK